MLSDAPNINHLWAGLLVEALVRAGCRFFVIAPGSRSTPLALAAVQHPHVEAVVHFDERGCAFHALGHARASGRPVVVICTSGSAVANLWPAVVEAEASEVPLILLTADRPPELLHTGANQAIDQEHIFGNYTRWACTLPCPSTEIAPQFLLTTVDHAVRRALTRPRGPVHFNCPFREPLAPMPQSGFDTIQYLAPLASWLSESLPYTALLRPGATPLPYSLPYSNGLIVAGELRDQEARAAALQLAGKLGWPLFPDITSGLRTGVDRAEVVGMYDQLLLSEVWRRAADFDCVVHLGGRITSRRLQQFLEELCGAREATATYLHVAPHALRLDPGHLVRQRIVMEIADFAAAVQVQPAPGKYATIREEVQCLEQWMDDWLERQEAVSEIAIARLVSALRPAGSVLYLGNSMPVRDMDMYAAAAGPPGPVHANRGASGIDGNIATAAGIATASTVPVTVVLGDLAALHDLNSLALLQQAQVPLVLIFINNNGGGIFSFLPVSASTPHFERCFGTPHGLEFKAAADLFGIAYSAPEGLVAFREEYGRSIQRAGATIIEVRTDRGENLALHREVQGELNTLLLERHGQAPRATDGNRS